MGYVSRCTIVMRSTRDIYTLSTVFVEKQTFPKYYVSYFHVCRRRRRSTGLRLTVQLQEQYDSISRYLSLQD